MEENAKSEEESFKTPGERIVKLCEKQQISQRELARRIGVTSSQISRILKGETKTINSDMLMALAQEFGVSTDYILGIVNNPENTQSVENTENLAAESKDMEERREQPFHTPMLLMSSAFPLGGCIDFIESLADQDEKMMAYAEYYYFSGHHEKAVEYAEMYLDLPVGDIPPLSDYVGEFKKGKQLWGVYVLAHKAYLDREYQRSLGIVEACLMTTKEIYPISMIYLNLVAAMNAMNLMQTELAKKYFMQAWEIARPDGLIEGIGEHHGLLQGLIETCLKKDYPKDYERIIAITYKFSFGWRRIHNPDTNEYVADNLTTTEFTIAMLASRGWTNQEIADYMQITPRTVKQHMTCIFNKISISNRKQLKEYMLR